jgi:hypothetical protein
MLIVLNASAFDEECSPTDEVLSRGVIDASFATAGVVWFQVKNNMSPEAGGDNNTHIDNSEMFLTDVDVRISTPQDGSIAGAVDNGLVEYNMPVAGDSFTGQEVVHVAVPITADTISQLGSAIAGSVGTSAVVTMIIEVEFHGLRASNEFGGLGEIDARPFTFPIDICFGCLRDCSGCPDVPECASDPSVGAGQCGYAQNNLIVPSVCEMAEGG